MRHTDSISAQSGQSNGRARGVVLVGARSNLDTRFAAFAKPRTPPRHRRLTLRSAWHLTVRARKIVSLPRDVVNGCKPWTLRHLRLRKIAGYFHMLFDRARIRIPHAHHHRSDACPLLAGDALEEPVQALLTSLPHSCRRRQPVNRQPFKQRREAAGRPGPRKLCHLLGDAMSQAKTRRADLPGSLLDAMPSQEISAVLPLFRFHDGRIFGQFIFIGTNVSLQGCPSRTGRTSSHPSFMPLR